MDEHEMRSRMAIEAAGMEVWDSTVVKYRRCEENDGNQRRCACLPQLW